MEDLRNREDLPDWVKEANQQKLSKKEIKNRKDELLKKLMEGEI